MNVNIVSYEDPDGWILGKFARMMELELKKLKVEVTVSRGPDPTADINHHIIYLNYDLSKALPNDTLMLTHVDSLDKYHLVFNQLERASLGICMSKETMDNLVSCGVPRHKLAFVNPAHDGIFVPKPIRIGITSKTHFDGRKREGDLIPIFSKLDPRYIDLEIMGFGWDIIVERIRAMGFTVIYHPEFDRETYKKILPQFDYCLYMSFDEGSMGMVDALASGVKTIVSPHGYHMDMPNGITHAVSHPDEVLEVLLKIQEGKKKLVESVADWSWEAYARRHLALWEALLCRKGRTGRRARWSRVFTWRHNHLLKKEEASRAYTREVQAALYGPPPPPPDPFDPKVWLRRKLGASLPRGMKTFLKKLISRL